MFASHAFGALYFSEVDIFSTFQPGKACLIDVPAYLACLEDRAAARACLGDQSAAIAILRNEDA